MSKNFCRMFGIIMMLISVFFLVGGLYINNTELPAYATPVSLITGIVLLIVGIVFYRILKSD